MAQIDSDERAEQKARSSAAPSRPSSRRFSLRGLMRPTGSKLGVAGLFLLALLVRLPAISGPPLEFAPSRETYDALRARIIYLDGTRLPEWKQNVLHEVKRAVPQIEPPLMEHAAALAYRLAGSEQIWIPRLFSIMFWLVGGLFLF